MPRIARIPRNRLHKPSGQAVVTLDGKDHYLGRVNSPESLAEYRRRTSEWLANGGCTPTPADDPTGFPDLTINEELLAGLSPVRRRLLPQGRQADQGAKACSG